MTSLRLDAVSIQSMLSGRIRFHLEFHFDELLGDAIRREVNKIPSAKLASFSVRTRNVLVTYDPKQASDLAVATALLRGVKGFARLHEDCDHAHHEEGHHGEAHHGEAHDEEDCEHDHSATATDAGIRKELLKLAATGGVLAFFVYRKVKGRPALFGGPSLMDLAAIVTILAGFRIFRAGMDSVQRHKKATDDTLISIAVISTILMRESLTGLSVVWLINLGRLLEAITLKRSRTAIKDLMDIAPREAWLVGKDVIFAGQVDVKRIPVEKIERRQIIRVYHEEKVPLDGKIVHGQGLLNEAFITGESLPREKSIGDTVYAGSLVEHGDIDVEVTSLVHDTVVARLIDAIENVREHKAPIEKIGNRFAAQFVPISIGLAGVTLLVTGDIRRAITMLVIACPCAAGLATPTAVSAGIGQAARKGILIKGGMHIETAARIDTVIFDKTGTLTMGEPVLHHFAFSDAGRETGEDRCLLLAASAEQHTTHPLGLALVKAARKRGFSLLPVQTHKNHPGLGITALLAGEEVHIGNRRFMQQAGIEIAPAVESSSLRGFLTGESLLFFALERELQGVFVVQDRLRPESKTLLAILRSRGIKRIILASGDQRVAAEHIARELGIREVYSEQLPAEKLALVTRLKSQGLRVAMVGDGVNDAQALAAADLSIAMGGGHCDVAIEAADIALARNDLMLVAETLDISKRTLRTIYQNFVAAVGINTGGLLVSTFGTLSPFSAAIVHNASTIAVVLNSFRLGRQVAQLKPSTIIQEVQHERAS